MSERPWGHNVRVAVDAVVVTVSQVPGPHSPQGAGRENRKVTCDTGCGAPVRGAALR